MEEWSKTHNFSVWTKILGINFHWFAMNALVSTRDYHPFVASMAFPDPPEVFFQTATTISFDPNIPSFHSSIIPIVSEAS